jgi:hypothetical protein
MQPSLIEGTSHLDWTLAIKRNRDQLKDIVLALFVLAGMRRGGLLFTLPRSTLAAIMLVLRPAESAVRRLIVIAAHGLILKPQAPRAAPVITPTSAAIAPSRAFSLFDPLKSFDPEDHWDNDNVNYESGYGLSAVPGFQHDATLDNQPVDASLIGLRLNALMRALDNIPQQARRLARRQAKRDALLKAYRLTRMSPIRPGLPPGWRERKIHEIDHVLRECHGLANDLLNAPDSS